MRHAGPEAYEAGRNITPIYANCRRLFAAKRPFAVNRLAVTRNKVPVIFGRPGRNGPYQLATDLLKMSVMILSVVVRTAVGSLLMVAMLRPAG